MNYVRKKLKKLHEKKGFTMMEMLIVVAIIAILIAVSVPIFTSQLDTAKKNTDMANQRAAKAVAAATYLTDESTTAGKTYIYDAGEGILVETGSSSKADEVTAYSKSLKDAEVLEITINSSGEIYMGWITAAKNPDALTENGTLVS